MPKVDEKILKTVQEAAKDGKLSCTMARKLAQDLGVSPKLVGEAAYILDIKIKACELGCF